MPLTSESEPNPAEEEALDWVGAVFLVLLFSLSLFVEFLEKFEYVCFAGISDDFYFLRRNLKNILEQFHSILGSLLGIIVIDLFQVSSL